VISPVFTMWITLVFLYVGGSRRGTAAASQSSWAAHDTRPAHVTACRVLPTSTRVLTDFVS
jgi:hypothetical protein